MKKFMISFGVGHVDNEGNNLYNKFLFVMADDEEEIRSYLSEIRGSAYAFLYDLDDSLFAQMIEEEIALGNPEYGLTSYEEIDMRVGAENANVD